MSILELVFEAFLFWQWMGLFYYISILAWWWAFKLNLEFKSPFLTHIATGPLVWTFKGFMDGCIEAEKSERKKMGPKEGGKA